MDARMEVESLDLKTLGWDEWFAERTDCGPAESVARVAAVDRELLLLLDGDGLFRAKLSGAFLHRHRSARELPCVGDWVCVEKPPGPSGQLGRDSRSVHTVHSLLERRTVLRRKVAGADVEYQMIAANVDAVVIVQSCHFDFNVNRLERYLVMVRDGGAEPYVLLTKTDLVSSAELDAQIAAIRSAGITAPVLTLSNVTREGVDEIRALLEPGRTYCFVGSSGVGKSTLINRLLGRELLETQTVSGTGEGRHTTVRRELMLLDGGALVIDNPGMRELGILGADDGLSASFGDVAALASGCRFRDCTHVSEPGCAVLEALESGELSRAQYENYRKLESESAFNQASYVERRKKDRAFGRYIKAVKKDLSKE